MEDNLRRRSFAGAASSSTTSPTKTAASTTTGTLHLNPSPTTDTATASGNNFIPNPSSPSTKVAPVAGTSSSSLSTLQYDQFDATVAATFLTSKGMELLKFAKRKVEEQDVKTSIVQSEDEMYNVLLMSLPYKRMLIVAEELGLRKRDLNGSIRTFRVEDTHLFTSSHTADSVFSQSEQILLIEYWLASIKPDESNFDDVIGNESILEWCKRQHYVDDVFPLHHRASAAAIMADLSWKSPFFDVGGISKVQDYFGDKVALYFAFLTFYAKALIIYGVFGLLVTILSGFFPKHSPILLFLYSIFASLWGAAFISLWKRRNTEIVFMWTSLIMGDSADESLMTMTKKEDLRRKFFGVEVSHRITGEKITIFPKREKLPRLALSVIIVLISLLVSSKLMLLALDFEDIMNDWLREKAYLYKWSSPYIMKDMLLPHVPTIVYLACLNLLDRAYSFLARWLTENENHKHNSDFENSHVFKLVLFQFLNMNMAYLYIAFIRRDYIKLSKSIRTVLLVELIIGNLKETVKPIFFASRKRKSRMAEALRKKREANPELDESECEVGLSDLNPITMQLDMEAYDGVFDDYLELVRQFSQISLFAAAFPLGALLAMLNNFIEIYTDSHKLVYMTRRASPQRALNIGAWIRAFECLSIVSVITNLGIITITARFSDAVVGKGISLTEEYFWMVVIEHVLIVARFGFATLFEGIPSWVRDQRAKERFAESKKANETSSASIATN